MNTLICETCGTRVAFGQDAQPSECRVCTDDRQYVGWTGQKWITPEVMQQRYRNRMEKDGAVFCIGVTPQFGIDQRALILPTDVGNIMWECVSHVTPQALDALKRMGGVSAIAISHPHFYSAMAEWSEALGNVPILVHEEDSSWVQCSQRNVQYWRGEIHSLSKSVTLVHCGGHFSGSAALHWASGPTAGGALFPGDALQVVFDRRHVTFMYSSPNYIPMAPSAVRAIRNRIAPYAFEDVYGFTWGRNIIGGGKAAVQESFERYFRALEITA